MKRTILSIAIAAIFAACNSTPAETSSAQTSQTTTMSATPDTTGYSQFQQWKQREDIMNNQGATEEMQSFNAEGVKETDDQPAKVVYQSAPQQPRVVKVVKPSTRRTTTRTVATSKSEPIAQAPRGAGTRESRSRTDLPTSGTSGGSETGVGTGTSGNDGDIVNAPGPEQTAKEGGWSKAAKGTAIGAGSGAVLGAILSKNKGKGAVIGGVVGAAGGYILGRKQDKKDGRN
jgi:hypothetical protein